MRLTTFAVVAALALLAMGCGGQDGDQATALGRSDGDAAVVAGSQAALGEVGVQPAAGAGVLPGITVIGSGKARAVPDVAEWSFGVQADADTAARALGEAGRATKRIVGALRHAGIAKEDVRTEQVYLYPRTTNDGRSVIGYTASSSVHATVRELGKAGSVVDAAVRAGANQVSGPALRVADNRTQYRAAVEAALDDARARAEALAAKAGVTLGGPIAIVESGGGSPMPVYERALAADAEGAIGIEPGIDEISATLTVTFAIS